MSLSKQADQMYLLGKLAFRIHMQRGHKYVKIPMLGILNGTQQSTTAKQNDLFERAYTPGVCTGRNLRLTFIRIKDIWGRTSRIVFRRDPPRA